jgi:SEC-C motif domain protein
MMTKYMRPATTGGTCPCGSGRTYPECCEPLHQQRNAATPEALMRSRYSAYALGRIDYLLATWHPSTAPGDLELGPTKWLGLQVIEAQEQGDAGVVEFIATYKVSGRLQRLHEVSRFVRESGQWLYIDGQMRED